MKIRIILMVIFLLTVNLSFLHAKKWYEFWKNADTSANDDFASWRKNRETEIRNTWKHEYLYNTSYHRINDWMYDKRMAYMVLEGLKNGPNVVKWFCCYKAVDMPDIIDSFELRPLLSALLTDESPEVKDAAAFTLAFIDKNYDERWFVKSPDGKKIVFTKYNEARYNNSGIWIIRDGKNSALIEGPLLGRTSNLTWSPDSNKLAFTSTGRHWSNVKIIKIDSSNKCEYYNVEQLLDYVRQYGEMNGLDMDWSHNNPYPNLGIDKWVNEEQLLLSYFYIGQKRNKGWMLYDLTKQDITKIYKTE